MVVDPFCKVQKYEGFGVKTPKGILIEGPSNVGKTALACALTNETGMACIYVSSPSLRSKIVGESELAISKLFSQAKSSAPCIILMDQVSFLLIEFEMLLSRRGKNQSSTGSSDRIVTTFLTEMDGIFTSTSIGVFIIASSNKTNQ
jgi:transitional endoplasmic reticulum ATPase